MSFSKPGSRVALAAMALMALGLVAARAPVVPAAGVAGRTVIAGAAERTPTCRPATAARTVAYARVRGVSANLTSLDLYAPRACRPAAKHLPVVIWVHGGGYAIGDKARQVRDKIRLFNGRGIVFISTNYRLTRAGDRRSARWPDHFRDVAAAVAWTRANVARYGGDPRRIALLGHSAGADIVANVTADPRWLRQRRLPLTSVRCAGPLDTEGFDKPHASKGEKAQWRNALGNAPDYLRTTSASTYVRRGTGIPRTITVVRGAARRQRIERAYADRLKAAGVPATVIDARALTHNEVNSRIGAPGDRIMTPPLAGFLARCFGR